MCLNNWMSSVLKSLVQSLCEKQHNIACIIISYVINIDNTAKMDKRLGTSVITYTWTQNNFPSQRHIIHVYIVENIQHKTENG